MKSVTYQRYQGDPLDELSMEQLADALADFVLQSGFPSPYDAWQEMPGEQTLAGLQQAIQQALIDSDLLDDAQRAFLANASPDQLAEVMHRITERLAEEGLIRIDAPPGRPQPGIGGHVGREGQVRFEVTDKALDFLGFRTLKDLLGGLGKASFGLHDTRDYATGVEAGGAFRPYEFGDTLNLDISATISHALRRAGLHVPIGLEYQDLMVRQSEYQSSCATVLLLDCSHSMILYGEDRFTPAKRVALALAHLIRTQYPGDSLQLVLFHDSAEEIPLSQLARVQVGPHYTNTHAGLQLAQRLLARQRKDMKQIVMITDGKPSALTLEDGRIYKNAFGLDPMVVGRTLDEVHRCRRSGILINTFMLASDHSLIQFVQKVTQICRGKAYFTTPRTLGQYLMQDFMTRKSRSIH